MLRLYMLRAFSCLCIEMCTCSRSLRTKKQCFFQLVEHISGCSIRPQHRQRHLNVSVMDYKTHAIQMRNRETGLFAGDLVDSCQVVGAVVECSLRTAYRPQPGILPVPLVVQDVALFPRVIFKDVLPPRHSEPCRTHAVQVYPTDAELGLKIVRGILERLQSDPYRLEVATVDHTGNSTCNISHDILLNTRVGGQSCLQAGLYSLEIRCRNVGSKTAFPWETTLSSECMELWRAELQSKARLQGRILVFACCMQPCPSGSMTLNGSINYNGRDDGWSRLFGWAGFSVPKPRQQHPSTIVENVGVVAAPEVAPRVSNVRANIVEAGSVQWAKKQAKLETVEGEWVKLASFLKAVGKLSGQAKRDFLEGPSAWKVGPGKGNKLVKKTHWDNRSGNRGGKPPLCVKRAVLEQIFYKYYMKR